MQKLWILTIAMFFSVLLSAQSPPVLTLKECIERAELNSFKLHSDEFEISVQEQNASLAKSYAIPKVSGELSTDNRFLQPYFFSQVWASVHADWSLGDLIQKTGRSSSQEVITRQLEKEQNRLNVIGRSTSLYVSIFQVKKQIEILEMRMGFLQKHYHLTNGMWKAGVRTQLDVLQTESEMVKLQEDTARLAIVRKNLRNELAGLLGWQNTDSLILAPININSVTEAPVFPVTPQSLANNPILASFDSKVKAQQFRTDEIVADYIPHFQLGTGYLADGDPTGDGNFWQINASIVIPIYSGNSLDIKKQGSTAILESLDSQKKEAERELMIHLIKVHEKLIKLKNLLALQNKREEITAKAVNYAEINYRAGISTNLDYLSAQQRLTDTQLSIEETRLEYTMSLIEYYITTNQVESIFALGNR